MGSGERAIRCCTDGKPGREAREEESVSIGNAKRAKSHYWESDGVAQRAISFSNSLRADCRPRFFDWVKLPTSRQHPLQGVSTVPAVQHNAPRAADPGRCATPGCREPRSATGPERGPGGRGGGCRHPAIPSNRSPFSTLAQSTTSLWVLQISELVTGRGRQRALRWFLAALIAFGMTGRGGLADRMSLRGSSPKARFEKGGVFFSSRAIPFFDLSMSLIMSMSLIQKG